MRFALMACSVVLLLGSLPARGEEGPPALTEVRLDGRPVTAVSPGDVIEVRGSGLHACPPLPEAAPRGACRHDELEVLLGRRRQLIVAVGADRLVLLVFDVPPPGRQTLEVRIRGRGRAALDVDVQERAPPRRPLPERPIEVTGAEVVEDWLEVRGDAAAVGTGATLLVSLAFEGRKLQRREVPVHGGGFFARLGPFGPGLPAGAYEVEVAFALRRQPAEVRERLERDLGADDRERLAGLEVRRALRVGSEDDARRRRADVVDHYQALADDLDGLAHDLDRWQTAAVNDPAGFARWARARFAPGLARARATEDAFAARSPFPLAPGAGPGVERLRALLAGWFLALAERVDAPADLRRLPDVEPAPAWTLRAGFDVERRLLLDAAGPR
ncbi:MAG: hypothetical protein KF878_19175 [Planctomycetes bacterium]|nr:hypothetical protein [Planctomycetota bacterium]